MPLCHGLWSVRIFCFNSEGGLVTDGTSCLPTPDSQCLQSAQCQAGSICLLSAETGHSLPCVLALSLPC